MNIKELEFLEQSNFIEGVHDSISLDQAVLAWNYILSKDVLTIENVLDTHNILMLHQNIDQKDKGQFRRCPVWIGGVEKKPWYLTEQVDNWIFLMNTIVEHKEVAIKDADFEQKPFGRTTHVMYEGIHPFIDGNGRTGRIFLNWLRVKCGLEVLIIREEERREYYNWFKC